MSYASPITFGTARYVSSTMLELPFLSFVCFDVLSEESRMRTRALYRISVILMATATLSLTACKKKKDDAPAAPTQEESLRDRVSRLTSPIVPVEGLDENRVALGERLYHDPNLSSDGTISCASCHDIANGGDDGLPVSPGVGGLLGGVSSPTTLNSHLNFAQFWDGRAQTLEEQAAGPIENPVEMANTFENVIAYLQSEESYVEGFNAAFDDGEINQDTITSAIADYERTLTTPNSKFDQWLEGDDNALNEQELAGLTEFMNVGCGSCHQGPGLGGTMYQRMGNVHDYFGSLARTLDANDYGRFNVTENEADRYRFKVPILRNIAETAPYMHNGEIEDLGEVVDVMAYHQLGRKLPQESIDNIVAFLGTLTGDMPSVDIEALNLPEPRTTAAAPQDDAEEADEAIAN